MLIATLRVNKTSVKFFHHMKPHTDMSTPNSHGLHTVLTVISTNIEGLTALKASVVLVLVSGTSTNAANTAASV